MVNYCEDLRRRLDESRWKEKKLLADDSKLRQACANVPKNGPGGNIYCREQVFVNQEIIDTREEIATLITEINFNGCI